MAKTGPWCLMRRLAWTCTPGKSRFRKLFVWGGGVTQDNFVEEGKRSLWFSIHSEGNCIFSYKCESVDVCCWFVISPTYLGLHFSIVFEDLSRNSVFFEPTWSPSLNTFSAMPHEENNEGKWVRLQCHDWGGRSWELYCMFVPFWGNFHTCNFPSSDMISLHIPHNMTFQLVHLVPLAKGVDRTLKTGLTLRLLNIIFLPQFALVLTPYGYTEL